MILATTAVHFRQQAEASHLTSEKNVLIQEAHSKGIEFNGGEAIGQRSFIRKKRETNQQTVSGFLTQWKKHQQNSGIDESGALDAVTVTLLDSLEGLNSEQLLSIRNQLETPNDEAGHRIKELLCHKYPTVFLDHVELHDARPDFVRGALRRLAITDPLSAQERYLKMESTLSPHLKAPFSDNAQDAILKAAATKDPQLAIQILKSLPAEIRKGGLSQLVFAIDSPESAARILPEMRNYLSGLPDSEQNPLRERTMNSFLFTLCQQGFDNASSILKKSSLTDAETKLILQQLDNHSYTGKDTGRWIEWAAGHADQKQVESTIGGMVTAWTAEDHQATADWLNESPPGRIKEVATRRYAEALAGYDPLTAAQWAEALSSPKERETTLRSIHRKWPANDPSGKAEFGGKHGF